MIGDSLRYPDEDPPSTALKEIIDTPKLLKRVDDLEKQLKHARQEATILRHAIKGYPSEPWAIEGSAIVTPFPFIDMGDSLAYYGGYLICESVTPTIASLLVQTPRMARLLREVAESECDLAHPLIGEIRETIECIPPPIEDETCS